jgi:hypothetical protein
MAIPGDGFGHSANSEQAKVALRYPELSKQSRYQSGPRHGHPNPPAKGWRKKEDAMTRCLPWMSTAAPCAATAGAAGPFEIDVILNFGQTRVSIAGDTATTPEMKALQDIDVAFLPMNLPDTMTPEMVADAARAIKPGILYPYHLGETDTGKLQKPLENQPGIEVRFRKMP